MHPSLTRHIRQPVTMRGVSQLFSASEYPDTCVVHDEFFNALVMDMNMLATISTITMHALQE